MVIRDKLPVGIYVNSITFKNLYKFLKYDLEFHLFGDSDKIQECVKYMMPYKKCVIVHSEELLRKDLLDLYIDTNICISIDVSNLSKKDIIIELPKYKNLLIEIDSNFDINILKDVVYYYNEHNKYNCGVIIESSSKEEYFEILRSNMSHGCYKDIVETLIRKYSVVGICDFIIPYREIFYSTDDDCIHYGDRIVPITTIDDFYEFYKSLYRIDDKCKDCIVSTHCNKYSVKCENELLFYTDIIKMMLNKVERD